ncbi:MAG TPA: hypothetical protein VGE31_00165 [Candidatus Paceibacterota bacterium]
MFRTRDYAVMVGVIGFLIVAIVVTLKGSISFGLGMKQGAAIFTATGDETTYSAAVAEEQSVSKEDRIAALKKAIASRDTNITMAETTPNVVPEVPEVPEAPTEEEVKENRCSGYYAYSGVWSPSGLVIEEAEGARLVYRPLTAPPVSASSTVSAAPSREIVAQLPLRSVPLASQSCIGMDVIGIAKDGSLIRNNEISMYRVFGPETLIGYALDGFPIYGLSAAATDICGGAMVGGQYRYQLSDRETMINCYAGAPISI